VSFFVSDGEAKPTVPEPEPEPAPKPESAAEVQKKKSKKVRNKSVRWYLIRIFQIVPEMVGTGMH